MEFIDAEEATEAAEEGAGAAAAEAAEAADDDDAAALLLEDAADAATALEWPAKACCSIGIRASGDKSTPITDDISRLAWRIIDTEGRSTGSTR